MVIENHQINRQSLEPQIFMPAQHLSHHIQIIQNADAHQHDRQIATDAILPQFGLRLFIQHQYI